MLAFDAAPRWPQRIELPIGSELGRFSLRLRAHAASGQGVLAVGVDDAVLAVLPFQDGRLSIERTLPLHLAVQKHRTLRLEVLDGGAVALEQLQLEREGDVAAEAHVGVPAGSLAVVREHSASTYHRETVELRTLADFPGLLLASDCEHAVRGLQQERRFLLLRHRTLRATTAGEAPGDLRRPFVLAADDDALPDLAVVPLQLARYEYFRLDGGELVLKNQPEPGTRSRVGFVWLPADRATGALPHLQRVFAAIDRPLALDLGELGTADVRADLPVPWTRLLAVRQPARTPFLVRENGWWTWRAAQPAGDGTDWLRVLQSPGDVVQIAGGHALLARTRPGPGALHTVALRDVGKDGATVRVLQPSPLVAPSVTMGQDFDEVFLDGEPWAWFDGRAVSLPNREGTWRVTTRRHGGRPSPHVVATRAVLDHCAFDPARQELVLVARADARRPAQLPFTALLAGGTPVSIEGGEIVGEDELRHASVAARAAAVGGGVVIRFRPGIVRVRYRPL
jgi:hypothetical protein